MRAKASTGARGPGAWAATTVRLALEYALTIERPAIVDPKAPSPTPDIAGIAGFPGALATCPEKTVALWCAKIATAAVPAAFVYRQTIPLPPAEEVTGPLEELPSAALA